MIVGQTGSGKSTVWKILQSVLSQMKKDGEPGYNAVKVIYLQRFSKLALH